jgi:hypothetical protein
MLIQYIPVVCITIKEDMLCTSHEDRTDNAQSLGLFVLFSVKLSTSAHRMGKYKKLNL